MNEPNDAFERRLADEVRRGYRPSRPIDPMAITRAAAGGTRTDRREIRTIFSTAKLVTAAAVLALVGGLASAGLLTLPANDAAPAGTTDEPQPVAAEAAIGDFTPVTGEAIESMVDDSGLLFWQNKGVWYISDVTSHHIMDWSDPRLPADMDGTLNTGFFGSEEVRPGQLMYGELLLEGPKGYWSGPLRSYYDSESVRHGWTQLTGHGAYEEMTAVLFSTTDRTCAECLAITGGIFDGPEPLVPKPLKPSAGG